MQQLLNGQYVDDQKYNELKELQEVQEVEREVAELTFNPIEKRFNDLLNMTASDFINSIKL